MGLPAFERYVTRVMGLLGQVTSLEPQAPGLLLSLGVAFLVGLSMNFLPCNVPNVMSLLPATTTAESRHAYLRRTALYAAGAMAVLGTLRGVNGVVLLALGSLLVVFAGLRAVVGVG